MTGGALLLLRRFKVVIVYTQDQLYMPFLHCGIGRLTFIACHDDGGDDGDDGDGDGDGDDGDDDDGAVWLSGWWALPLPYIYPSPSVITTRFCALQNSQLPSKTESHLQYMKAATLLYHYRSGPYY